MKRSRKPRRFKTEQEEREFWETNDSSDHVDWAKAKSVSLPNLKSSSNLSVEDNQENPQR